MSLALEPGPLEVSRHSANSYCQKVLRRRLSINVTGGNSSPALYGAGDSTYPVEDDCPGSGTRWHPRYRDLDGDDLPLDLQFPESSPCFRRNAASGSFADRK